jgi:uncharacterized membrane protein
MLPKILRSLSPIALVAAAFNFVAPAPLVAQATSSLVTTRLTQPIDENARVTLKGTVHPLAKTARDLGAAPESMPLDRLTLVLKRSDAQETALKQLIQDMHTPGSASYHKWLTPDAFGKQFGPSDQDIATVEAWLQSHGFAVTKLNVGRQSIEISGNVSQFRNTFHAQIHKFSLNGETHYSNTTDPQIPSALAPVVAGFASLNNFRPKSYARKLGEATYNTKTSKITPQWTISPSANQYEFALSPGDYAVQYDLNPLYSAGINGTGQTIAIVNESNINIYLVNQFRTLFNLPANPPQVIIDGNDPGVDGINNPDGPNYASVEAYLDVEWSGAVAPNATVDLVIAADTALENGLFLALERAVYSNVAPVVSISFGNCENTLGTTNQFLNAIFEQAAAQGQTVLVSTGDSGSAGCDDDNSQYYAVDGQAVSGWASTPYNVAVGGTDFAYLNSSNAVDSSVIPNYWSLTPSNNTPNVTLLKPIPEQPWNESQYGLNINSILSESGNTVTSIAGGGGGASNCATGTYGNSGQTVTCTAGYPKPSWQTGTGVPNDNVRDIPDLSLFASSGINASFYVICATDGDCQPVSSSDTVQIFGVGGTSASAPSFAGIMALVNQKNGGPQGQADYVLYQLAAQFPAAFHDVTNGTNSVPCAFSPSSPNCISVTGAPTITDPNLGPALEGQVGTGTTAEYNATPGYDLATGLGTLDANVLVNDWGNVKLGSSTVTLSSPTAGTYAHGSTVTFTANVAGTSPTGSVALMTSSTEPGNQGIANATLNSSGTATATTTLLPGGTYNVWAHYGGDGKNAQENSLPTSITVTPESSGIYFNLFSPAGTNSTGTITSGATIDYGTQILLSAQIAPSSQLAAFESCFTNTSTKCPVFGTPTGTVTFGDGSTTINTAVLNAEGDAEYNAPFGVGSHSVTALYNGDNSYNKSPQPTPAVTFTVQKDTPQIFISAANQDGNGDFITGQPTVFNIEVLNGAASNSATNTSVFPVPIAPPTGTITVSGLPGGSQTATLSALVDPTVQGAAAIATVTIPASTSSGTPTITIKYPGDSNYNSTSVNGQISIVSTSGLASTTTANVTGSISPSTSITITGTVTGQSSHPAPTGTVFVYSSGNLSASSGAPLPAATLITGSSDVSTFSLTLNSQSLVQGTNFITLQYTGDNNYKPSAYQLSTAVSSPLSDFSMVPETTIVPVTAGGSGTDTINLSSVNGFAGAVSFTCAGTTVTCGVTSSATLSGGSTSPLTLTINAGSGVAGGTYNVLVTGKDSTGHFVHTLGIEAVVAGATTPGFSLSASPSSLSLGAGETGTAVITATPSNSFTGTVALTCAVTGPSGATSPATCTLNPTSPDITSGAVTSTLTVDTTTSTTAGTYTVTVTGTSGTITANTSVTVTVNPPYTLSANPTTLSLTGGATTGNTSVISVAPFGGFTGNVALACSVTGPSGATSPATCTLSPTTAMISGSSAVTSTLTVATTTSTTGGAYTVTVTGTSGMLSESTTVTATVAAPPPPTFALTNGGGITVTQGDSGTSMITVTPSNGFTGNVALTCTSSNSSAVSCTLNPTTADVTSTSAVTSTLTVNTTSNSGVLDRPLNKFFGLGGGALVALLVFFGIPARRRSWRTILGVLVFGAIVGIGIGCGGSGNGGGGGSANYTVTVTGTPTSGSAQTTTVSVTVSK